MYPKPGGSLHVINTEKSDVNLLDLFFGSFSDCIALNWTASNVHNPLYTWLLILLQASQSARV